MRCSKCGADNREGQRFCTQCGSPLATKCPACGAAIEPAEKFCGACGAALTIPPAAIGKSDEPQIRVAETAAPENLEGERKTVTALFADIKGSTELEQDLDPEQASAIIDPALKIMIDAVRRYDGYIPQSTGDGIFAVFGAPFAHEDHPRRALHAALRMQEDLRRYSAKLVAEGGVPLQCRVGVNTGEVVVRSISTGEDQTEYAPIGHTTNLASRMQAVAPAGSIAVTEQVRKLCEGYFAFKSLGPTEVKGVSEAVNVYEVTGLGPSRTRLQRAAARGYTTFVGRDGEMEALRRAAEQAKAGHGQIVAVMAEPGVGKSRLFHEFKVRHRSDWMVLEAPWVSFSKASANLPVFELLHSYFGIEPEDDSRKRREKVSGKVLTLDRNLEDALPYLLRLLGLNEGDDPLAGMDAQIRRRRTLEALKRILLRQSLNQPLMVVFEDLHWIDGETQAFLNVLADSIGTAKLMLMVNYRPEYSHEWSGKTYYTQLRLDPLGRDSAGEMFDALFGVNALTIDPPLLALRRLIIEKTEGTPLFMEEIHQALIEEGALIRNGVVKLSRPLSALKIPTTVQAILASRIDRLPAADKEVLQTLAVIGIEFPLTLAREVIRKPDDELNRALSDLQLTEFIYEQPAVGDIEYTFKHALTQEVAYNSLLVERRRTLHERTAKAIEELYSQRLEDHLAELAHHYERGKQPAKAVEYLSRAAQQAAARSAFAEAITHARAGLGLIAKLHSPQHARREFELLTTLATAATALEGWDSAQASAGRERMIALARTSGDEVELATAFAAAWVEHLSAGRYERSLEMAHHMVSLAERRQRPGALADAQTALGWTSVWIGRIGEALEAFDRAFALCADGVGRMSLIGMHPMVELHCFFAQANCAAGRLERALRSVESNFQRARELNQPFSLSLSLFQAGWTLVERGEPAAAVRMAQEGAAVARQGGYPSLLAGCNYIEGWAVSRLGQTERGIALIHDGIENWTMGMCKYQHVMLADAHLRAGQSSEALVALNTYRELANISGEHFGDSEAERLEAKAVMLMDPGSASTTEQHLRRAIAIAREQGAKTFELRATTSLARMLRDTNRRDEARAMLAEIYNWFTEGFDTADLKDARALLEELSS
jgi:class 3 adenylate cyclase/tetratricopeptide (TPR) repeat protein